MSDAKRPSKPRAPTRTSKRSSPADGVPLAPSQFDLFPVKPTIDVLDPRKVVGESTSVQHLVRVKLGPTDAPHLVFHDRHGWYCEAHGAACASVALARTASGQDGVA